MISRYRQTARAMLASCLSYCFPADLPRLCLGLISPFPNLNGAKNIVCARRLLAHSLAEVLWDQLLLDVSGGGGVFTLGDTSRLIGTTLAAVVSAVAAGARERWVARV